ncbi:MAG: hypothetical protein ACR2MG_07240 [Pyrinomonadaceae bacterium]
MKKQTKSNLLKSLQSLGIIFAIFFALAFACGDEDDGTQTGGNFPVIPGTAWKIDAGPGRNVQVFLFCKSGRWEVVSSQLLKQKDLSIEGGAVTLMGTYTVKGDTITAKMDNGPTDNYKMRWNDSILELDDGKGTIMRLYDKVETECK